MKIKKVKVNAELLITIQADKDISDENVLKASLFTEMTINNQCGFTLIDDEGTKVFYRCHIKETQR